MKSSTLRPLVLSGMALSVLAATIVLFAGSLFPRLRPVATSPLLERSEGESTEWIEPAELSVSDRETWLQARQALVEAQRLHAAGKYQEAIESAQASSAAFERLGSAFDRWKLSTQLTLGQLYREHSLWYSQATPLLTKVRRAFEEANRTDDPEYAICLYELATLLHDQSDFSAADELYHLCLEKQKSLVGEESAEFARTLNHQGRLHIAWWKDYAHGKCYTALAIRERKLGRLHPDYAESLEDLAIHHLGLPNREAYDQAAALLEEAIRIRETVQGPQHPAIAETLSLMGQVMTERGDLAQALLMHQRALAIAESARGVSHPEVARLCQRFAGLSFYDWDMARGKRLCQRALEIWKSQPFAPTLEQAMTEADLARIWLLEADLLLDEDIGDLQHVDQLFWQARKSAEAITGANKLPFYARCLAGHASLCYRSNYVLHDREFAREQLRTALDIMAGSSLGELHPAFEPFLTAIADWHRGLAEYSEAEEYARQRIKLVEKNVGVTHPDRYTDALQGLGGVFLHAGNRPKEVQRIAAECLSIQEELFRKNAAREGEVGRIALLFKRFYSVSGLLSAADFSGDATELYREVYLLRGAVSACRRAEQLVHDHSELRPQVEALGQARRILTRLLYQQAPKDEVQRESWISQIIKAGDAKERLECELAVAVRPLIESTPELKLEQLQRQLPKGVAWIDFFEYVHHSPPSDHKGRLVREKHVLAFVLRENSSVRCVSLGTSRLLREAVEQWRAALTQDSSEGDATLGESAFKLAQHIWLPIAPLVAGAEELVIAPDGPISGVSFAALPSGVGSEYLLERFAISYIPSLQYAYSNRESPKLDAISEKRLLAIGPVDYTGLMVPDLLATESEWQELPASAIEISEISEQFNRSNIVRATVMQGSAPRVDDVLGELEAASSPFTHVHFAGHGFLATPPTNRFPMLDNDFWARNRLLLSGLVLAPSESAEREAILTAEELSGVDLRRTKLVVLSACETGLGYSAAGEGALGLQRVLLNAGVDNVVSSLWRVDDAATCALMREFHRQLWEKKSAPSVALRESQLKVMQDPTLLPKESQFLALRGVKPGSARALSRTIVSAGRTHPAAWAAFVLTRGAGSQAGEVDVSSFQPSEESNR